MATITFQRKNKQAIMISGAVNFNGYLTTTHQVGVGEGIEKGALIDGEGETWKEYDHYITCLKPCYDSAKLSQEQSKYLKGKNFVDINEAIADGWADYLIRYESNDDYIIIDLDQAAKDEEAKYFKSILDKSQPIEFGVNGFGIQLKKKIPLEIFNQIKSLGTYWNAEQIDDWFDDMDDFHLVGSGRYYAGWYFNAEVFKALDTLGYSYTKS